MPYTTIAFNTLQSFCLEVFSRLGFTKTQSAIISDVLLRADLYGIESHGIQRLIRYETDISRGMIYPQRSPVVVWETPISAVIDGNEGMGQLIAHHAMQVAITKAQNSGIGMVTVRNSNHYGIAGYYAKMACDEGLIGMSFTNSSPLMVPTFAKVAALGSNPIALCAPAKPYPLLFDASTAVITRGKVEVYNKNNKALDDGWAVDEEGAPSNDAARVLAAMRQKQGGILPLGGGEEATGGHKGYGFAMISEFFSSVLALGETSNHTYEGLHCGVCHGFIALNPNLFGDPKAIEEHLSVLMQELRDLPKAEGKGRIYTHGEKEIEAMERCMREGIPVNDSTVAELTGIAKRLGVEGSFLGK